MTEKKKIYIYININIFEIYFLFIFLFYIFIYYFLLLFSGTQLRICVQVATPLDSAIQRINHYPADSVIGCRNTYRLDSDLSGG